MLFGLLFLLVCLSCLFRFWIALTGTVSVCPFLPWSYHPCQVLAWFPRLAPALMPLTNQDVPVSVCGPSLLARPAPRPLTLPPVHLAASVASSSRALAPSGRLRLLALIIVLCRSYTSSLALTSPPPLLFWPAFPPSHTTSLGAACTHLPPHLPSTVPLLTFSYFRVQELDHHRFVSPVADALSRYHPDSAACVCPGRTARLLALATPPRCSGPLGAARSPDRGLPRFPRNLLRPSCLRPVD